MDEVEALRRLRGRTVALDYDVPVHSYVSGWTGPEPTDAPTRGALEFVERLLDAGVVVVIHTCRASTVEGLEATVAWLRHHGFPDLHVTAEKPIADAYVDDRAVPWRGSWSDALTDAASLVKP